MLFSNWIITEKVLTDVKDDHTGLCLVPDQQWLQSGGLLRDLQAMRPVRPLSLLMTENTISGMKGEEARCIDLLVSLFFQPGYLVLSECPVLFLAEGVAASADFFTALEEQCLVQGFKGVLRVQPSGKQDGGEVVVYERGNRPDYGALVEGWTQKCLGRNYPFPIFLLADPAEDGYDPEGMERGEKEVMRLDTYKAAEKLYDSYVKMAAYEQRFRLLEISLQNKDLYLEIQKQDLAIALNWYKYEYDILPLWYKQFGHIIKVLMGKRSFRSLFNDHVKKYKD
jgi:hypothetical protein